MESNVSVSPQTVYENLNQLDQVDLTTSAEYREMAQDVLADSDINKDVREAIADRLNEANQQLTNTTVSKTDSY
jgi:Fe2+ or Zn2+ uptake regulation protein